MGCGTTPFHDSPEYFEWRALVFLSVYHMEYVCWWHPTAGFMTMMQLIVTHEEIWRDLIVVRQCFQTDVSATKLSLHGMWCCCHAYANFQSLYFTILVRFTRLQLCSCLSWTWNFLYDAHHDFQLVGKGDAANWSDFQRLMLGADCFHVKL